MDLKDCLKKMQDAGRLAHVTTPVDAVHELGVSARSWTAAKHWCLII